MTFIEKITAILEEPLHARGYGLVRILYSGSRRKTLQIMIERLDETNITVEDCADVSRLTSVLLDIQDPISDPYVLEISSPGLERPLVKKADYERFHGHEIVVSLIKGQLNHKKIRGIIHSVDETGVTLGNLNVPNPQGEELSVAFENIRSAHLYIDFEKVVI